MAGGLEGRVTNDRAFVIRSLLARLFFLLGAAASIAAPPVLIPGPSIAIDDVHGKFGLLTLDPAAHRLLAPHVNDGVVEIFDLRANQLIARVTVGPVVALAVDPKTGRYFASVQDDRRIAVIDGGTLKETSSIPLPAEPGAMLFDPKRRHLYVAADGAKSLWVVDPEARKLVGTIVVPEDPEDMVWDARTGRIYLAGSATSEVAVIDPKANTVISRWPTAPAIGGCGVALDAARNRLFVAGDNGQLVVLDLQTGRVVAQALIGQHVGQVAYDADLSRLYCAGRDWMYPVDCAGPGLVPLEKVYTATSATNVAIDPQTHAVWTTFTDGEDSFAKSWSWR